MLVKMANGRRFLGMIE